MGDQFTIRDTNFGALQVVPKYRWCGPNQNSSKINLNPDIHCSTQNGLVTMWERTLQDLIRGLRANKHDEARFINQAIDEIRTEARSKEMEVKAAAILKMTFVSSIV